MSDVCPRCHNDRENEHERDGTYLCWCGDLLSLYVKDSDVDELELALRRYLTFDSAYDAPRTIIYEILDRIKEWKNR